MKNITCVNKVNIRPLQEEDINKVGNIERVSFSSPWTSRLFYLEMKKNFAYYWVLEFEGKLVGYGGYWKIQDEAHLTTFAIHPSYRRRGLGKILLFYVLEDARKQGMKKVTLEVRKSNFAAQALYEKSGFKKIAVRSHYYHDTDEDALIYWKTLD
ncbi:ribosomal protein S18-alanine N-acetyltransferase [Candidatus Aerophobetes bacterium]|nr:ribosomal protein S18-alanine N-acetyltransferase [Candidatus Aerophobetes bacterium]